MPIAGVPTVVARRMLPAFQALVGCLVSTAADAVTAAADGASLVLLEVCISTFASHLWCQLWTASCFSSGKDHRDARVFVPCSATQHYAILALVAMGYAYLVHVCG